MCENIEKLVGRYNISRYTNKNKWISGVLFSLVFWEFLS